MNEYWIWTSDIAGPCASYGDNTPAMLLHLRKYVEYVGDGNITIMDNISLLFYLNN